MTQFCDEEHKTTKARPNQEYALPELHQRTDHTAITSRSTRTKDQHQKLLALLRQGPQTTYSLRRYGLAQCAARVFHLRGLGHVITTKRVMAIDSDGFVHMGVALYTLLKESEAQPC